jgi:hypothetical protein
MKIRTGFVSNSSSSSFCIYGCCFETSEIEEILKEKYSDKSEDEISDMICEDLGSEEMFKNLDVITDYECGNVWIGRSWSKITDDETGRQFKESITSKLKEIFDDKDLECSTFDEVIQN